VKLQDLTVAWLSFDPFPVYQRDTVYVNTTISRLGNWTPGQDILVRFLVDDIVMDETTVSLEVDIQANVSFLWPGTEVISLLTFTVAVDPEDSIFECYETNNNATQVVQIFGLPDLIMDQVVISPSIIYEGDLTVFDLDFTSTSNYALTARIDLYIDEALYDTTTIGMSSNSQNSRTFTWTAVVGTHTYTAEINSDTPMEEWDDNNNTLYGFFTVYERPDLWVEELTIPQGRVFEGDNVTFGVDVGSYMHYVQNETVRIDLRVDGSTIGTDTVTFTGSGTTPLTFNWTALYGDHEVEVVIDPWWTLTESNETNNIMIDSLSVVRRPDLYIERITFSNNSPIAGSVIYLNVTVGAALDFPIAGSIIVEVLADGVSMVVETVDIGNNSMTNLSFEWKTIKGDHNFEIIIDRDDSVDELDEDNNGGHASILVQPKETKKPYRFSEDLSFVLVMLLIVFVLVISLALGAVIYVKLRDKGGPPPQQQAYYPPGAQPYQAQPPPAPAQPPPEQPPVAQPTTEAPPPTPQPVQETPAEPKPSSTSDELIEPESWPKPGSFVEKK
jgi:subtilase family serine protease